MSKLVDLAAKKTVAKKGPHNQGVTIRMKEENYKCLMLHAMQYGVTMSSLIDCLIEKHLCEFSVVKKSPR